MDNYSLVFNSVLEKLQSGKTVDEITAKIIKSANEEFNYEVDFSFINEILDELNRLRFDTYNYSTTDELEKAFQNTLEYFNINISNSILVNALRTLSKSDKLINIDNIPYYVKISHVLTIVEEYKNVMIDYQKLQSLSSLEKGIALWRNSYINECIDARIKNLDEVLHFNKNNISLILSKNLLIEFRKDAYSMDFALFSLHLISKENISFNIINEDKYDLIINYRKFLNASSPLKIEDFYKSAQISLLLLYKKYNFIDTIMGLKTRLSGEKILNSIDLIMEYMLNMPKSTLYNACLTKPIQVKTHFFNTTIYEYRTKKNVKLHPVFENEQEFKTISRTIL